MVLKLISDNKRGHSRPYCALDYDDILEIHSSLLNSYAIQLSSIK